MTVSFADLAAMEGRGLTWMLDISFDDFATTSYRWAMHELSFSGNQYEQRILAIGNIKRGFGLDHLPAASSVSMVIDNTDFGADWLVNRGTVATEVLRARFKLYCALTTADGVTPATVLRQQVGVFACLDFPRRNASAVQLSLADDALGKLSDVLTAPSVKDWAADVGSDYTNSLFGGEYLYDKSLPTPIQLGKPPFTALAVANSFKNPTGNDFDAGNFGAGRRGSTYPILVLATRSLDAIGSSGVTQLRGVFRTDVENDKYGRAGSAIRIPEVFTIQNSSGSPLISARIWKAYKTQTLTVDGYTWQLLWIAIDMENYAFFMQGGLIGGIGGIGTSSFSPGIPTAKGYTGGFAPAYASGATFPAKHRDAYLGAFEYFLVDGSPGSGVVDGSGGFTGVAADILKDMVESYSSMGTGAVDGTRFARCGLFTQNIIVAGSISGLSSSNGNALSSRISPYGVGALRQALAELAATADVDVFLQMDGKVGFVAQGADFTSITATFPIIAEEEINNVEDYTPSAGERWAPYNRVYIPSDAFGGTGASGHGFGPYDNAAGVAAMGRIIPKTVPSKWWTEVQNMGGNNKPFLQDSAQVWRTRNLEAKVRPIISFTTNLGILALDLGDYFTMGWTRGGVNAAYASTLWRLESVSISPANGEVTATAVWMEDERTTYPYLLDNEVLVVRATPGFVDDLTVTDGSFIVTRFAGSFITDGLVHGDIIRLLDSSEPFDEFTRNRDVRVQSIDSATQVTLDPATDTDFGTAGAHVVIASQWQMLRGATTYPNAVSDPANYPSGGLMYGKVSHAGLYSDGSAGNQILDG